MGELISTGDIRTWMGIEEGDRKPNAKLDSLTLAIEAFVASFTNRQLLAQTYTQDFDYSYLDGNGKPWIYLPVYPVSYVSDVRIDNDHEFGSGSVLASADFYWESSGKLISKAGYFTRGRRNVRVDYTAGYAPIVGGTHAAAVSSYPLPYDLRQTMIEMCVESFKEGITAVHTVQNVAQQGEAKFVQMLSRNSFWSATLTKYKSFSAQFMSREE